MSREGEDFEELVSDTDAIFEILLSDLPDLVKGTMPADPQSLRRHYCRALFAWIEGHLESLKRQFLFDQWWQVDEQTEDQLRSHRRIELPDGTMQYRPAHLPLVKDMKLTFRAIAEAQTLEPLVADDDSGWETIVRASRIRNRIVHPKRATELTITDDELLCLRKSAAWYIDKSTHVMMENAKETLRRSRVQEKLAEEHFKREAGESSR